MAVDFEKLKKVNDDVIGWIHNPDTVIDYPVVQGDDNDYYLNHLINGTYNASGTPFLDVNMKSDFSEKSYRYLVKASVKPYRLCRYITPNYFGVCYLDAAALVKNFLSEIGKKYFYFLVTVLILATVKDPIGIYRDILTL